jgi:alpha-L-fucosidase
MFIHFGVYSSLGGVWKEEPIKKGYSEQIQSHAGIFSDEYEKIARDFRPFAWNTDSITALAKDAGMRSIIVTAKHHDGFCLFQTATTSFNIVDFTPYKKDLISGLAESCHKKGLNFGVYFSVIDWHLPEAQPISSHNADLIPPAHHQINMTQVKELMTNYGPISEIWFDMGANTPEQSKELKELVHQLLPQCMVSGRIGNDQGDFNVMGDNDYPNFLMEVPWQTPASIFDETWGYRSWQERGSALEKAKQKLRSFINVIAHGGNYLLNIGPEGDGSLVDFESEVLRNIGRWIKVNKEAIYGSSPNPFHSKLSFGQATQKDNHLYLFIDSIPSSARLMLPGLKTKILSARFMGSGIPLKIDQSSEPKEIIWTAPAMADPMEMPVIEVTLEGTPVVKDEPIIEATEEGLNLTPHNAQLLRSFTGADYYTMIPSTTGMIWHFNSPYPLAEAEIHFTEYEKGRQIEITSGSKTQIVSLEGKALKLVRNSEDSLKVAPSFRSEEFIGGLSDITVNTTGTYRRAISTGDWMRPDETNAQGSHPLPRSAHYYFIEVTSEHTQQYCFTITGNDGLQVWVNREEKLLERNQKPGTPMKRTLVVSLTEGNNQLLIKNYNRHGSPDHFAMEKEPAAQWYTIKVPILLSGESSDLILKGVNPPTLHTPLDLPNLWIKIIPSEGDKNK